MLFFFCFGYIRRIASFFLFAKDNYLRGDGACYNQGSERHYDPAVDASFIIDPDPVGDFIFEPEIIVYVDDICELYFFGIQINSFEKNKQGGVVFVNDKARLIEKTSDLYLINRQIIVKNFLELLGVICVSAMLTISVYQKTVFVNKNHRGAVVLLQLFLFPHIS